MAGPGVHGAIMAVVFFTAIAHGRKVNLGAARAFSASTQRHAAAAPATTSAEAAVGQPAVQNIAPVSAAPVTQAIKKAENQTSPRAPAAASLASAETALRSSNKTDVQGVNASAAAAQNSAAVAAANSAATAASAAVAAAHASAAAAMAASAAAGAAAAATTATTAATVAKQVPLVVPPSHAVSGPSFLWYWLTINAPQAMTFIQGITFALVVKTLCMAGNVLVQISPFPQVKRWEARGCTGDVDPAPYVSIAFGGWQWCFYGTFAFLVTKRSGFLILVHSNCLGAILGTYYAFTFYRNCRCVQMLDSFHRYLSAVASLVVLQVCQLFVLPADRALFLTGLVSSFCSFVGAMSILVVVPAVIRTRDAKTISGPLVVANMMSAIVWCICGWMLEDFLVAGPNMVAMVSSGLCVLLKWRYPSSDDVEAKVMKEECTAKLALDGLVPVKPAPPPESAPEKCTPTKSWPEKVVDAERNDTCCTTKASGELNAGGSTGGTC